MASTQQDGAGPALVTGYDKLRVSLAERKNWRRAKKIDNKLPLKKTKNNRGAHTLSRRAIS